MKVMMGETVDWMHRKPCQVSEPERWKIPFIDVLHFCY